MVRKSHRQGSRMGRITMYSRTKHRSKGTGTARSTRLDRLTTKNSLSKRLQDKTQTGQPSLRLISSSMTLNRIDINPLIVLILKLPVGHTPSMWRYGCWTLSISLHSEGAMNLAGKLAQPLMQGRQSWAGHCRKFGRRQQARASLPLANYLLS